MPELIHMVELAEKGTPPKAGGSLDQSQWFLDAARFIGNLQAQCREKLRARRG
jgi:hypothetical protein